MGEEKKNLCEVPNHKRMSLSTGKAKKGTKIENNARYEIPIKGTLIGYVTEVKDNEAAQECLEQHVISNLILEAEESINSNPKFSHLRLHLFHADEEIAQTALEKLMAQGMTEDEAKAYIKSKLEAEMGF